MKKLEKHFCLIVGDFLEDLIHLLRSEKLSGNAVFAYIFKGEDSNLYIAPLANALYKNGDYTLFEHIYFDCRIIPLDNIKKQQIIYVKNNACDDLFKNEIFNIQINYCLSLQETAIFYMKQIGIPQKYITDYIKKNIVYLYEGFKITPISQDDTPELYDILNQIKGEVYAVLPDPFPEMENQKYNFLIWDKNPRNKYLMVKTLDCDTGRISSVRSVNQSDLEGQDYYYTGVFTSNGGVWCIPNEIAESKSFRYKFDKNELYRETIILDEDFTQKDNIERFILEYAKEKIISETTIRAYLKFALKYEEIYNKNLTEFSIEEILRMIKDCHSISIGSIQNRVMCLERFCNWLAQNNNVTVSNNFAHINKDMLKPCLDKERCKLKMIDRAEIVEWENLLYNWTDKAIIELLFLGAQGKQGREYCFFDNDNVDYLNKKIRFYTGKEVSVDERCLEILNNAFNETKLLPYTRKRAKNVISYGIYKEAVNVRFENNEITDDGAADRRYRFVQRRLKDVLKDYLGVDLIPQNIRDSGLLYYIKLDIEKKSTTFSEYICTDECRLLAQRYGLKSELYRQILVEKFGKFF